jgi:hypothetical protein
MKEIQELTQASQEMIDLVFQLRFSDHQYFCL